MLDVTDVACLGGRPATASSGQLWLLDSPDEAEHSRLTGVRALGAISRRPPDQSFARAGQSRNISIAFRLALAGGPEANLAEIDGSETPTLDDVQQLRRLQSRPRTLVLWHKRDTPVDRHNVAALIE
jgi:hypothetical protein